MSVEVQLRRFNSMERRPKMLKDFLSENPNLNSCSSTGFKTFPRRTPNGVVAVRNSTFQTVIKKIRHISLLTKSPSVLSLPRSISRKLSSRRSRGIETCNSTVKIKDIMRWKSFRDLQPSSVPSPLPSDFHRYTTESFTTTTASCSSGGSSWSEGDFFTASWEAQNDGVEVGNSKNKKVSFSPFFVGKDSVAPFVGTKEDLICQEDEQNSPVSVLQVGEDEFSLFDQSLANIERRKQKFKQTVQKLESLAKFDLGSLDQLCLSLDENSYFDEEYEVGDDDDEEVEDQKCEEQEWIEKRAKKLLHCVKATTSSLQGCDDYLGEVVLDFFREELTRNRNQNRNDEVFELEILRIAEDWIKGSFAYEDIVHVNKDDYIKNMDRRGGWSRFKEEEQKELVLEIEADILHNLVVGLLDLDS